MADRRYTRQFRENAMRLVTEQEYTPTRAARELGMPDGTLVQWLRKAGWRPPPKAPVPLPTAPASDDPAVLKARLKELEEENRRLRMEKEILKKATAYFARENA